MQNTFIMLHANGISMDEAATRFTALAVENGIIRAVGSKDDMAPFMAMGWPVHDLQNQTLLPGFIDTHQHTVLAGQVMDGLDFSPATCLDDIFQSIAEAARTIPPGEWIMGYSANDLNLRELRLPTREELDRVCTTHPVLVVQCSWHMCSLNSMALDIFNLPSGLDGLDVENGQPTGIVRDPGALTHVFPALSRQRSPESKLASCRRAAYSALRRGVTTMHALEGGEYGPGDGVLFANNMDSMPVHMVLWNQVMDIEETVELGLPRIGGCICADGAIDCYTAAFFEPYTNQPENRGVLNFTQEEMDTFILRAHEAGLQIAIHCETDRSIEQVLSAMEKALQKSPRKDHRHRIEHVEVPTYDQIDRMAKAGIIASMQPAFLPCLVDMEDYRQRIGDDRLRRLHPYRTILDAGVKVCGGSDCPVTPHDPLMGVQGAVLHPVESERISVVEALRMFTCDAAFSSFEENLRGSIEPGKVADLVVLDADPLAVSPDAISGIRVVRAYVDGKPVEQPRDGPDSRS